MDGQLIVIEGLDGCGKSTQLERLKNKYGDKARFISFPNYDSASGEIIKQYLTDGFHEENSMTGCYTAAGFYAIDRYISYKTDWEKDYKDGRLIVAARYTSSNAIYQMAKLPKEQWDGFLDWLTDHEFVKFAIPKPALTVFLDMPTEISQQLLSGRYDGDEQKKDIHEKNVAFLQSCRSAAMYAAEKQGWVILPCSADGKPLSVEEVGEKLEKIIEEKIKI
ncbi:MAG: deoxynucleoside kinase [Eubacterium sp.]|nr:deoxynucleoside kinase [Eubacterium sp.]